MPNIITFIQKPEISTFSPPNGFTGVPFTITGNNLEDAELVYFINAFEGKTEVPFQKVVDQYGQTSLSGVIPAIDSTFGVHIVRVENAVGYSDKCCFSPLMSTQTSIANISGDDVEQIDDKYAINAEINNTPTNTQGFEVINISYTPVSPSTKLVVQCELSLQSSFWGAAVIALFKGNETTPRKVWNYVLLGTSFGQVAKLGYVADSENLSTQTWRVRLGRAEGTFPIIYVNRNAITSTPYGGNTSSWAMITEIDD